MSDLVGYREANDAVLNLASAQRDRVTIFARLIPADGVAEADRCLTAVARGLKLHPCSDEFDNPGFDGVFALGGGRPTLSFLAVCRACRQAAA
ncbi:hypothetical protein [Kribbella sp. VKM Ac-2568]|uniref:hypothetical protein n=1 Tax=Kribbella sp. VKM Ac-2568 TaxID=2512219 RepID=UPI0010490287|nr:hypothetical protein [Kribbella sp. VKM Ac-2568]